MKACLDFPPRISVELNPLQNLLKRDHRDPQAKGRSVAYAYAFRRLLRMLPHPPRDRSFTSVSNRSALQSILENITFSPSFLIRTLLTDVHDIVATFPKERNPEAFLMITRSNYVYALSTLLRQPGEVGDIVQTYLRYQLLFPISASSIVAHYFPFIGLEADSSYLGEIGNISEYPQEVTWLITQLFKKGNWKESPYPDALELEFGAVIDVVNHFPTGDVTKARQELALAVRGGMSESEITRILTIAEEEDQVVNIASVEAVRETLSFLPANLIDITQDQARELLQKIAGVKIYARHLDDFVKIQLSNMIATLHDLPKVEQRKQRMFSQRDST